MNELFPVSSVFPKSAPDNLNINDADSVAKGFIKFNLSHARHEKVAKVKDSMSHLPSSFRTMSCQTLCLASRVSSFK